MPNWSVTEYVAVFGASAAIVGPIVAVVTSRITGRFQRAAGQDRNESDERRQFYTDVTKRLEVVEGRLQDCEDDRQALWDELRKGKGGD